MYMKSLFESSAAEEIKGRIAHLRPGCERQWGKMTVAQMLAHCSAWMEMAAGLSSPPRSLIGRVFGRMAKSKVLYSKEPIGRNMPTEKSLVVSNEPNFAAERQRLLEWIDRFVLGGPEKCTKHPHCFFGPMTPAEWARMGYKHLDHHLRQFGA
jgi:transposase InsO family protein